MGQGVKHDLTAQHLHLLEDFLRFMPVVYGGLKCLVLLLRQRHGHRLGLDLARPLVARTARPRTAGLNMAVADPPQPAQPGT